MVAKHGIVPTFDVQIGIVSSSEQGVHNLRPVGLAEAGEAVLSHTRMAEAIDFQQVAIDEGVFCVNVENS